ADGGGRIAVGGVAPKPWRVEAAEAAMPQGGKAVTSILMAGARTTPESAFKLKLLERTLSAVLAQPRKETT
ncbi:MAG TPA: xanthine dehydrogenase family protein subunit M, partial [Duganella sp.]